MHAICKSILAVAMMQTVFKIAGGVLVQLDPHNSKTLDMGVRGELLTQLNQRIEKLSTEYKLYRSACKRNIDRASAKCEGCMDEKKRQANSNGYKLLTLLFLPDIILTEYLKFQEKALKEVVAVLGKHSIKFLKELTKFSKQLTESLKNGIVDLGKTTIKGVEHLAKQLGKSVTDIAKVTVKTVEDLGKGLGGLVTEAGKGLTNLGKGVADATKNIVKGGVNVIKNTVKVTSNLLNGATKAAGSVLKAVTNPIKSWGKKKRGLRVGDSPQVTEEMFKRSLDELMKEAYREKKDLRKPAKRSSPEFRRMAKRILYEKFLDLGSCPTCDKIDFSKRSTEDIMKDLCSDVTPEQEKIVKLDKFARSLFDYVKDNKVLTKVTYNANPTVFDANGVPSYTEVHIQAKLNDKTFSYKTTAALNYGKVAEMMPIIAKELMDKSIP
ncbi:hypothetical protein FSP39_024373 [Pinctada imbricata]|uniref:Uncharacterized protein n=1 Tax=Pinctada imbricata TaxID=66713 RepID=A0AA88YH58_PINIB|nr:hypothetical protein FSP39_024373 [Pinctada imbricata]